MSTTEVARFDTAGTVAAAAGGDRTAWEALVGRFAGLVWAVGRAHGLDSAGAADVSRSVWLELAQNLAALPHPERAGAWLAGATNRECLRRTGDGASR